jgi:hypothetical protein
MKVITSSNLIAADRFMDRYGLSFFNNFVNSISKACMALYRQCFGEEALKKSRMASSLEKYWTYIDKKDKTTCGLGLIPIPGVGSICIYLKNKREKLLEKRISRKSSWTLKVEGLQMMY